MGEGKRRHADLKWTFGIEALVSTSPRSPAPLACATCPPGLPFFRRPALMPVQPGWLCCVLGSAMAFSEVWLVGGRSISPGKPQAPSLGSLVCPRACLVPWLLVPVASMWCVRVKRRPWSILMTTVWQGPNGPLLPHPREMPLSPSQNLISSHPAWMAMGTGRSTWPVSTYPAGATPGPGPALNGLRISPSPPCSGVPGRAPGAAEEPVTASHHSHSCHAHVTAQELQHRPRRGSGPKLPLHQHQWVCRPWGSPRYEVTGRGCMWVPMVGGMWRTKKSGDGG